MKKLSLLLLAFFLLAALVACTPKNANPPVTEEPPTNGENPKVEEPKQEEPKQEEPKQEEPSEEYMLKEFFLRDGAVAKFIGEGNEYAGCTCTTQWLNDRYVNVYSDNGGTVVLQTYRIDEDKIVLIHREAEVYEPVNPTEEELEAMPVLSTYLQLPLETGATFDGWTVVDTKATLETPLQTFTNVIVIEKIDEEGTLNRSYFAKAFGEIKSEYILKVGDEEHTITSTIAEITYTK